MNASPNISYYTAGTAPPVEIDGAVVLKGVIAASVDTSDYEGVFLEFKNGGSGGDVLYKIQLVLVNGSGNRVDAGASKIVIPGSGIRFDSGLYFEPTTAKVRGITIIYQGGSVA